MPEDESGYRGQLTDEQRAFDDRLDSLIEDLDNSGWVTGGGWDLSELRFDIGSGFDPDIKGLKVDDVIGSLPIKDENGRLLPGFEVADDTDTGTIFVSYNGPLDEAAERVFSAMVEVGSRNLESLTELGVELGRLATSPEAGFIDLAKSELERLGLNGLTAATDDRLAVASMQLVRDAVYKWSAAVYDAEETEAIS